MPDDIGMIQLPESVTRLSEVIFDEVALEGVLGLVTSLGLVAVGDASAISISLYQGERLETVAGTAESIRALDELQYGPTGGPCVESIATGEVLHVIFESESRWSDLSTAAKTGGFRQLLCLPLEAGGRPRGALNVYSCSDQPFDGGAIDAACRFAAHASVVLANASAFAAAERKNEHLLAALETRERIGEAKGILMHRDGLTSDEAFQHLRKESQRTNRKLRDVAQDVIDSTSRSTP